MRARDGQVEREIDMKKQAVLLGLGLFVGACGSSRDSSDSGASASCDLTESTFKASKATAVAKASGSDASCPDVTPANLNDASGDDAGTTDGCEPMLDERACTMKSSCTANGIKTSFSFKMVGSKISGAITLEGKLDGVHTVSCTYDVIRSVK